MALPELLKKSAEKLLTEFCLQREPCCEQNHSRLSFRIGDDRVTLIEERWAYLEQGRWLVQPMAQFRYHSELVQWSLHYFNNSKKTWVFYLNVGPSLDLAKLLRHVEDDPFNMFWR
jgi:hypothetical protein